MTRAELASRLRPVVQAQVERGNIRGIAAAIGLPHTTLHSFLTGSVPQAENLDKIEQWAEREGLLDGVRDMAVMSGNERERVVKRLLTMRAEIDELVRLLRGGEE